MALLLPSKWHSTKKEENKGEKEAGKKQSAKMQAHFLLYWLNENYFH